MAAEPIIGFEPRRRLVPAATIITFDVIGTKWHGAFIVPIRSFKNRDTEALFQGRKVRRFQAFQTSAERRLLALDSAMSLSDLRQVPGNRFEALGGDRKGQFSIRINDRWRVCFAWAPDDPSDANDPLLAKGEPYDVEIVDYH